MHGCGVNEVGTENEGLSPEGMLRVEGLMKHIQDKTYEVLTIVFSGGNVEKAKGQRFSEAEHMKSYFDEWYVGDNNHNVILEDQSNNSIANIDNALQLIPKEQDIIYIVSSDYHIPRLLKTYQNRIEKGNLEISDLNTVLAMDVLKDSPDQDIQEMLQQFHARSFFQKGKGMLVELVGHGLANLGQEDMIERIPSNTPLWKVPLEIIKVLSVKKGA